MNITSQVYAKGELFDAQSGFPHRCDDLKPYATYAHEYFVAYGNLHATTLAIYQGLRHGWNCATDGMATIDNLRDWIACHNAALRAQGAEVETVKAALYRSQTGELACEVWS